MRKETAGTIISVGAGKNQKEFIDAVKKRGYKVCAFGKGKNDAATINKCDFFDEIDTSNSEEALAWIDSLNEKIIGAGSFAGGVAIDTLQKIERAYDLPTKIPANLSVGMNKFEQQLLYKSLNIGFINTLSLDDINKNTIDIKKEYILKPAVGRGSSEVYKASGEALISLYKKQYYNKNFVVQEYLHGDEFRIFVMVQDGQIKILSPIKRSSKKGTYLLGRLEYFANKEKKLYDFFEKLVQNTGVNSCIIKADLIISAAGEEKIIEMDIGVGGGKYFKNFISQIIGSNVTELYIDLILGEKISQNAKKPIKHHLMDYCYIDQKRYQVKKKLIDNFFGSLLGECEIQYNSMLKKEFSGKAEVNSDFMVAVMHHQTNISNQEINVEFNKFMDSNMAIHYG